MSKKLPYKFNWSCNIRRAIHSWDSLPVPWCFLCGLLPPGFCSLPHCLPLTCSSLMRSLILAVASSWARNRLMTLARSGSKMFPSSSRTTRSSSRILQWEAGEVMEGDEGQWKGHEWRWKSRREEDRGVIRGRRERRGEKKEVRQEQMSLCKQVIWFWSRHTCCHSQSWRWLSAWAPWIRHWAECQTGAGNATPLAPTSASGPASHAPVYWPGQVDVWH